jgi:hypothetical protein
VCFAREAFDAHGHVAETTWQRAIDAG